MRSLHAFAGGVHPLGNKNTDVLPSIHLHGFPEVELLMQQHIGPPCTCVVKPGDHVDVGTLVGSIQVFPEPSKKSTMLYLPMVRR